MENGSVFKNKNFLLLFQGSLTSAIAATLYSFAISFYILDITENNASVQGTYLFVCGLVYLLASFLGGVLADRWNKSRILWGSDLIKGISILISFVLLKIFISNGQNLPQLAVLFAIGIINNALAAVFNPASVALIPEIVGKDRLMQANSLFSLLNSAVSILGIVLAAMLYSMLPITLLFLIIGVLYVLSGISELFIRTEHIKKPGSITLKNMMRDFSDGLKYLWQLKPVFYLTAASLFLNFFITPVSANLLPYIIKTDVSVNDYIFSNMLSPESWSAVFSLLFGVGSIIMSVIMASRKKKTSEGRAVKVWLAVISAVFFGVSVCYAVCAGNNISAFLIAMSAGMLLFGFAVVGINLPINVVMQRDVKQGMLAKVESISTIVSCGLSPFASLIAGILLSSLGPSVLSFFCAAGLVLTTVAVCFSKEISSL